MKKKHFLMAALLYLSCTAAVLTACGGDDNDNPATILPDMGTPPYQSVSGLYQVTTPGSPYRSIELGASGNYIVTLADADGRSAATPSLQPGHSALHFAGRPRPQARATQYGNLVYGAFTALGDGRYQLEDFGTITLSADAAGQVTAITVDSSRYGNATLSVDKEDELPADDMTNALCRTWRLQSVRYVTTEIATGTVHEETVLPGEDPDQGEEFLFSRAGTYLVRFGSGSLEMAEWRWRDQADGSFYYAWDGEWHREAYATIRFINSTTAIVHDSFVDEGLQEESYVTLVTDEVTTGSDDDEPQQPGQPAAESPIARVFGDRILKTLGDALYTYEDGFLASITTDYGDVTTFHYNYATGSMGVDVYTTDTDEEGSHVEQTATLGENGFVASVHHEVYDVLTTFEYDAEGRITHIVDGREGREYELTWENGDLVQVTRWHYDEYPLEKSTYLYTYSDQPSNGIMRFYKDYNIDLDVVEEFYYAGLMGIHTRHLIATEASTSHDFVVRYVWTDHDVTKYSESEPEGRVDYTFSFYE